MADRSLPDLFAGMGDVFVLDETSPAGEHRYGQDDIAAMADRAQAGLASLGVHEGDRVAVWLPNGVEYLALLWAAARLGIVIVSINTRFRSTEVADIVGRSGSRFLVLDPGFLGIDFESILRSIQPDDLPRLEGLITLGSGTRDWPWPATSFDALCSVGVDSSDRSNIDLPYIVFTTSGTTRAPKLVLHNQSSATAHALDLASWFGSSALVAVPLCGVFGYTVMLGAIGASANQILQPVFDGAAAAHAIERHGIETFHGSDEMIARIAEVATDAGLDLSSLGPVGYARFNNALEDIPERAAAVGVTAVGLYGMSEVLALFAHRPAGPVDRVAVPGGHLVSGNADARVTDPSTGQPVSDGTDGELQLRGPSLFAGYLADGGNEIDAVLTDEHLDDGWFRTGDLARLDAPRSFEYIARMGDVLRLGGFLVSPAEIEGRLIDHPAIEAAQVVSVDLVGGPKAVAFVTTTDDAADFDEQGVRQFCRDGLAGYKVPARIVALSEFPTTASANGTKIQKVKLRDHAASLFV
ncbi:MAG: AMP-binding protein [Acidimicrobiales bacterium]|jgi:fatty-acyl-CoA synthase